MKLQIKRRMSETGVTKEESYGKYVWAIPATDGINFYRHLTREEQDLFNELTSYYYASVDCDKI
jgi:hypothetical protein